MNISHAVILLTNTLDTPPTPDGDATRAADQIIADLVRALTHFESQHAEQLISEAFAIHPFEQVLLDVIQPTMVEIGERWHRGEVNVAAEHFATQLVRRKLAGLLNIFEGVGQRATIVIGCGPHELHDLGALLVALFLVRRGWHVVYLGPQVPLVDLLDMVRMVKPNLVCLSASTLDTAAELAIVARGLVEVFPQLQLGYGGRVFNANPELCHGMPGTFLGHNARELVDVVGTLLGRGSPSNTE